MYCKYYLLNSYIEIFLSSDGLTDFVSKSKMKKVVKEFYKQIRKHDKDTKNLLPEQSTLRLRRLAQQDHINDDNITILRVTVLTLLEGHITAPHGK